MFSNAVETAMNEQIKNELYSAYLYLSMSAYLESINLPGFAHWMRLQSEEEVEHAMKFFDYINERGGKVVLDAIAQPPVEWEGPLQVFEQAYAHEQKITAMIETIYELATTEKDYASQFMLEWYINEQVEEERNAAEIVDQIKRMGDHSTAVFMLDQKLGSRSKE